MCVTAPACCQACSMNLTRTHVALQQTFCSFASLSVIDLQCTVAVDHCLIESTCQLMLCVAARTLTPTREQRTSVRPSTACMCAWLCWRLYSAHSANLHTQCSVHIIRARVAFTFHTSTAAATNFLKLL